MSTKRVLVTDDHPSIRFLLRSLVETEQFTVCGEAANGAEAMEAVVDSRTHCRMNTETRHATLACS